MTSAYVLCEERDADTHQFPRFSALECLLTFLLLFAELLVSDCLHRLMKSGLIVPGIINPAKRRGIRELLAPNEIFHSEFSRIHFEFLRHDVHAAFDRISCLGDAEVTAICNTARRLVSVNAINRNMRGWKVV